MTRSILEFIPNQPFAFQEIGVDNECWSVCDNDRYALLYQPFDPIKAQFRQRWGEEDTKPNVVCQPDFNILGTDLLTNGSFTGGASGWSISDGQVVPVNDALAVNVGNVGPTTEITQALANTAGRKYLISMEIRDYVRGSVSGRIGTTGWAGGIAGNGIGQKIVTGDGVNGFKIEFSVDSEFTLDNVKVFDITDSCWIIDAPLGGVGYFNTDGTGFTKIASNALTIYNSGTGLNASPFGLLFNGYYAFRVKIKNRTQGTFTIKHGSDSIDFTENGEFAKFLVVNAPNFTEYKFDADFDGTIERLDCFPLYHSASGDGFVFHLVDMAGTFAGDISSYTYYNEDFVTIFTSPDVINSGLNPYGCYRIKVADPLIDADEYSNQLPQGDFNDDTPWSVPSGMSVNDTGVTGRAGRLFVSVNGTISTNVTLVDGKTYYLYLSRIQNTAAYTVQVKYGGVVLLTYNITAGDPSNIGHGFTINAPANDLLEITFTGLTANTLFEEAKLVLDTNDFESFNFESNVISYQEFHECTMILEAYSPGHNNGFYFDQQFFGFPVNDYVPGLFSLWQRLKVLSFNPSYPSSQDINIQSDEYDSLQASSRKKYKTLHFNNVDENMHDCISMMRVCQYLYVYPATGFATPTVPMFSHEYRYSAKKEDYSVDNDRNGKRTLAQSRMEVGPARNNKFYTRTV